MKEEEPPPLEELGPVALGTLLSGYRVEGRIGQGAMGVVYHGVEPRIGKKVAIKVLRRRVEEDPQGAGRFEREARAVNAIAHPHIADVFAFGTTDDGHPYLVMNLLIGNTVREFLEREGAFSPDSAWKILRAVAEALQAAHEKGVIHRDLKPENVFIESSHQGQNTRLLDFGIAQFSEIAAPKLTQTGVPLGTPAYMPPEQWWGKKVGPAADVYAFGCLWFEMLAGRSPFPAEGYVQLLQAHLSQQPPSLTTLVPSIPDPLAHLVASMLAKDPQARPASMAEVLEKGDALSKTVLPLTDPKPLTEKTLAAPSPAVEEKVVRPSPNFLPSLLPVSTALMVPLLALPSLGYRGVRSPLDMARLGGWGTWMALALFLLVGMGILGIALQRRNRIRIHGVDSAWESPLSNVLLAGACLLPFLAGELATATGWGAVKGGIAEFPDAGERFLVFHLGASEAQAGRFLGGILGAGLLLAGAALVTDVGPPYRQRKPLSPLLLALGVAAGVGALILGDGGAGFLVGVAAMAVLGLKTGARGKGSPGDLLLTLAVLAAGVAAVARLDARQAFLWAEEGTRGARALAIVEGARDRVGALWLAGWSLLWVGVALGGTPVSSRKWGALLSLVAGLLAVDFSISSQMGTQRDVLWRELAPQFSLWSRLDPPMVEGEPPPHLAPALQLGREGIWVDGVRIMPRSALTSPDSPTAQILLSALGARLQGQEERPTGSPDLLVAADRTLPAMGVQVALEVAAALGVRTVEVLLVRGEAPRLPPGAPPEAAYVIPRDLGALTLLLAPTGKGEDGVVPEAKETWDHLVERLRREGKRGGSPTLVLPPS